MKWASDVTEVKPRSCSAPEAEPSTMADEPSVADLINNLKAEESKERLESVEQLSVIATALGQQRTRDELLPFLNDTIDDEDEVLLALAEQLGQFIEYVGGGEWAYTLLLPLETLAAVEEGAVRDKATSSIHTVAAALSEEHVREHLIPLIKRLGAGEWFTSRVSGVVRLSSGHELAPPSCSEQSSLLHRAPPSRTPS